MNILVIGSGGREHAICMKLAESSRLGELYCTGKNPGIAKIAQCVDIEQTNGAALRDFALKNDIQLAVIGPEAPLVAGVGDILREAGIAVFGPGHAGAQLEGSKAYSKMMMQRAGILTADWGEFTDIEGAIAFAARFGGKVAVKADGLAAGKGVVVAQDMQTAESAIRMMLADKVFGAACDSIVIEEAMSGREVSLLYFVSDNAVVPMVTARDHKRVGDGDTGPNTGGMGAFSPSGAQDDMLMESVRQSVVMPLLRELAKDGISYRGVLYVGVMVTEQGPKVLEFNARFGDPETQVILPRLKTDFIDVLEAAATGRLLGMELEWNPDSCICVVLACHGYPEHPRSGDEITNLPEDSANLWVIHAGTRVNEAGKLVTAGGRVLGVTALAGDFSSARKLAYVAAEKIAFDGKHYRKDIGTISEK